VQWKIAGSVVVFAFLLSIAVGYGATRNFPNVDEVGHFTTAHYLHETGRYDLYRVNPPLSNLVSSLFVDDSIAHEFDWRWVSESHIANRRYEFALGLDVLSRLKLDLVPLFKLPRFIALTIAAAGVFLLLLAYRRAQLGLRELFVVVLLWSTWPDLLAHGPTLSPDIYSVLAGIILAIAGLRFLSDLTYGSAVLCGISMGVALLTKLTWITGTVAFATTLVCIASLSMEGTFLRRFGSLASRLAVMGIIAIFTLDCGYAFEHVFIPLKEMQFGSRMFGNVSPPLSGNRFAGTWFGEIPVPLPRNYLYGVDYLRLEVELKALSFLNGEWRLGSWPHYYVLTTLCKTPEPTLIAAIFGAIVFLVGCVKGLFKKETIRFVLLLTCPAIVCFLSVSLAGGFNHHHRYVANIYPPMFVFASFLASPQSRDVFCRRKRDDVTWKSFKSEFSAKTISSRLVGYLKQMHWTFWLSLCLLTLSVVSSLRVHPHYTSYFNSLSGGPDNGWKRLGFSNVDWGQDLLLVDKWLKQHPECIPIKSELDYFHFDHELFTSPPVAPGVLNSPRVVQERLPALPKGASIDEVRNRITVTQWWIVSVKKLYNQDGIPGLEYLQQIQPVDKIAYSYHVYRIDPLPPEESSSPDEPTP
jgi:hypothetical protein